MVNMKRLYLVIITILAALALTGAVYGFGATNDEVLAINDAPIIEETSNTINKENNVSEVTTKVTTTTKNSTAANTTTTTKKVTTKKVTKTVEYVIDTKTNDDIKEVTSIGKVINNGDSAYLSKLNEQLNKVPKKVLDTFKKEGWNIYITGENLAQTHFEGKYKSVQGLTSYSYKQILIEDRPEAVRESTIHELGHYVDYHFNFISGSDEFKNIYNKEVETFKSNITNSSCVRSEKEFFAEMFYYIYTNPSKCTPEAKTFILTLVNKL